MTKLEIIKTIKEELSVIDECTVFNGEIEKTIVITESAIERIADKLVKNQGLSHHFSDSFEFTYEEMKSMTNRELIIYCEYLKLKQYPLFWRYVDEVKIEK